MMAKLTTIARPRRPRRGRVTTDIKTRGRGGRAWISGQANPLFRFGISRARPKLTAVAGSVRAIHLLSRLTLTLKS